MIYYFIHKLRRQVWNTLDLQVWVKYPKQVITKNAKSKPLSATFITLYLLWGKLYFFKFQKFFFLAFAYSSYTRCDLSTGNCPPSNARIPWLKKTMTSRLYQKRQKGNLDKKLRFIPDNHGPYKKPAEDVGFIWRRFATMTKIQRERRIIYCQ